MSALTGKQVQHLQKFVRGGLIFGIVTSITANVIHSLTQPHDQTWQAWSSAGLSALAPVVLFLTTEMVLRIPLHSRFLGAFRLVITLAIAGFSGWVSYWHMVDVSMMLGERSGSQYFYPLMIDGMMIVATVSLIELGRLGATVQSVEVAAEAEKVEARRCKPGCTCGRHKRKTTRKVTRKAQTPKAPKAATVAVVEAPVSPGVGPIGEYAGRRA